MDILFANSRLRKLCNEQWAAEKRWSKQRAKVLRERLDELRDGDNLAVMKTLPHARCHELKGNRKGQLAVDLDRGWRLIFKPADDLIPRKPDGGLDWSGVQTVLILEVEDYHD